MSAPLESYLRTYRKRSGLFQNDVAFLLGNQSGTKVSRYERRTRRPTLETALAYEAIFRVPVAELFAGLSQKVENRVQERARLMAGKLSSAKPSRSNLRKLAMLNALLDDGAKRESRQ